MVNSETRHGTDQQKMRNVGRILGFFSAYSELETGFATYHIEYDVATLCDPKTLSNPKQLKQLKQRKEATDPNAVYLKEDDCRNLYAEGWTEGHDQGTHAHKTGDLELIGEIARLAGGLAPFYSHYTTAENDARDCKVTGDARTLFIANWRQTGGDKRKKKGI